MMDDLFQRFDSGDADIARHLAVFADIELSPSVAGTTAMRMTVMNAAHRRAALLEADRTIEAQATWAARKPSPPIELPRRSFWETWRRPMAAILAGCMTLDDPRRNGLVGPAGRPPVCRSAVDRDGEPARRPP